MTDSKNIPFGLHLMLDMYDCDPTTLNDTKLVYTILDELPEKIGMHKLTRPYVVFSEGNDKKDPGGWSGFVIIQESHIALHTFIKRRFVTIDVYSCKEFDTTIAKEYFKKAFRTENAEIIEEVRGRNYPSEDID
jgi:S-adenosylmethionine decarboxylase